MTTILLISGGVIVFIFVIIILDGLSTKDYPVYYHYEDLQENLLLQSVSIFEYKYDKKRNIDTTEFMVSLIMNKRHYDYFITAENLKEEFFDYDDLCSIPEYNSDDDNTSEKKDLMPENIINQESWKRIKEACEACKRKTLK